MIKLEPPGNSVRIGVRFEICISWRISVCLKGYVLRSETSPVECGNVAGFSEHGNRIWVGIRRLTDFGEIFLRELDSVAPSRATIPVGVIVTCGDEALLIAISFDLEVAVIHWLMVCQPDAILKDEQ